LDMNLPGQNLFARSISLSAGGANTKALDVAKSGLALKAGEQLHGLIVSLGEGAASVKGRIVLDEKQKPPSGPVRVYVVPSEKDSDDDVLRYAEANVEGDGSFEMKHLAPGKYWILAREIGDRYAAATDHPIEPCIGAQALEPRTGAQPLARDAGGRLSLRFEGEALKKTLDLTPCQRVTDYALPYVPL